MSDIKIDMTNNKEKFADYIASELKESYKNEKSSLVVIDTQHGIEMAPCGAPVDLCSITSMGVVSVIRAVSKQIALPETVVFKSIMQVIEKDLNGVQG